MAPKVACTLGQRRNGGGQGLSGTRSLPKGQDLPGQTLWEQRGKGMAQRGEDYKVQRVRKGVRNNILRKDKTKWGTELMTSCPWKLCALKPLTSLGLSVEVGHGLI